MNRIDRLSKNSFAPLLALCAACLLLPADAAAKPLLPKTPDAKRVAEIAALLDEKPSWCGESTTAPNAGRAEALLAKPIPECRDEDFLLYVKTGDRMVYQRLYFDRQNTMRELARYAEKTGDERFVRRVAEYLDAIAAERTWKLPAHDSKLTDFRGETVTIDLGSAGRASALAEVLSILGAKLPPATVARVRAEAERRIFAPYRAAAKSRSGDAGGNWWFFGTSNWNAVCHAHVVLAALAMLDSRDDRAVFVEGAERGVRFFLSGLLDDGYCSEGGGYWNYGYGNFLRLVLAVRRASQGRVDFGSLPTAKRPMRYGFFYRLTGDTCPNFADGGSSAASRENLLAGAEIWPELKPLLDGKLPLHTWFPSGEVYIGRAGGFAFAVKGGNNNEMHNHNDVGSWDLSIDGVTVAGDPQGEVYTARTFSPDRYVSKVLNSYGHPVPVVGGELQPPGAQFKAKILSTTFADDRDEFVIDLANAYAKPPKRLVRTATFVRGDAPSATVRDDVAFVKPTAFETAFVTYGEVEKSSDGKSLVVMATSKGGDRTARLRVDVEATGGDWEWASETIENPGRPSPHRWAVRFAAPVREATVTFAMRPL